MTTGMPRFIALLTGADQRRVVERRQRDAGDAARDGVLDLADLRIAIVLAQRSAPRDRDAELLRRLLGAGVDALPEGVRRALRNHRHRDAAVASSCRPNTPRRRAIAARTQRAAEYIDALFPFEWINGECRPLDRFSEDVDYALALCCPRPVIPSSTTSPAFK